MKNKRIQYKNGGSVKLHKNFDDLNTSLNIKNNTFNATINKKLPKGFEVSVGVSKFEKQKPSYGITLSKKF